MTDIPTGEPVQPPSGPPPSGPPPAGPPPSDPPPSGPPPSGPPQFTAPPVGSVAGVPLSLWRRSRTDRKIAGVCGGLGRLLGIDPLVLRVVFVVLAVFGGVGLLAYGAAWLLVPQEGEDESEADRLLHGRASRSVWKVLAVCVLGVLAVSGWDGGGPGLTRLLVIAVLGFAVFTVFRRRGGFVAGGAPYAPYAAAQGAAGSGAGFAPYTVTGPSTPMYAPPRYGPYSGSPVATTVAPPAPQPKRPPSPVRTITVSMAVLVVGVLLWVQTRGSGSADVAVLAAAVLMVVGAGLIAAAWWGHARRLAVLAIVAGLVLASVATIGVPLRGGIGERTWHPTSPGDVSAPFRLAIGHATLDLQDIPLGDQPVDIRVTTAIGRIDVVVPQDVTVLTTGHAGLGNVRTPGDFASGKDDGGADVTVLRTDAPAGLSRGTIRIKADVGIGVVEVRRATP